MRTSGCRGGPTGPGAVDGRPGPGPARTVVQERQGQADISSWKLCQTLTTARLPLLTQRAQDSPGSRARGRVPTASRGDGRAGHLAGSRCATMSSTAGVLPSVLCASAPSVELLPPSGRPAASVCEIRSAEARCSRAQIRFSRVCQSSLATGLRSGRVSVLPPRLGKVTCAQNDDGTRLRFEQVNVPIREKGRKATPI